MVFVILLPDADVEGAACVAATVHAAVSRLVVEAEGVNVGTITVSIGLAQALPCEEGTTADLYRRADAALYQAKSDGRNRTCQAPSCPDRRRGSKSGSLPLRVVGGTG